MRRLWLMCLLLWGCQQTAPSITRPLPQWHDQYFLKKPSLPSAETIFALDKQQQQWLLQTEAPVAAAEKLQWLLDKLYRQPITGLRYVPMKTLTARQTWQQRQGNCLSLAILTVQSARYLGLGAQLQQVSVPPRWSRDGDLITIAEHVNLRVEISSPADFTPQRRWRIVDFQADYQRYWPRATVLSDSATVAFFYHNLAVAFIRRNELSEAYWAVKAALQRYPQSVSSWNLLGVLYRRAGLGQPALAAYQYALTLEPEAPAIWQNLAVLYQQLAMPAKAADASAKVQALAPKNPYRYIDLANKALDDGQLAAAEQGYRQALAIDDINDEALWGMAQLYLARGERQEALRWLKKALAMAASEELLQRITAWQQQHRL